MDPDFLKFINSLSHDFAKYVVFVDLDFLKFYGIQAANERGGVGT